MKRILALAAVLVFILGGVAMAADVAPTLTDVMKAITELKADIAELKADGFTKANTSGQLATAKTTDGQIILEITSLMAGPDATVVGVKITNNSKDAQPSFSELSTTLTAGTKELDIEMTTSSGTVLPGTSKQFVLLAGPMEKNAKELVMRTRVIDSKAYKTLMEPTITIKVAK